MYKIFCKISVRNAKKVNIKISQKDFTGGLIYPKINRTKSWEVRLYFCTIDNKNKESGTGGTMQNAYSTTNGNNIVEFTTSKSAEKLADERKTSFLQTKPQKETIYIIKKDGTKEEYNIQKIINAVNKSAARMLVKLTDEDLKEICDFVTNKVNQRTGDTVEIAEMHNIVEGALEYLNPKVAQSYRNYRNYKQDFVSMLDKVYQESQRIMYIGDKENSNADSTWLFVTVTSTSTTCQHAVIQ